MRQTGRVGRVLTGLVTVVAGLLGAIGPASPAAGAGEVLPAGGHGFNWVVVSVTIPADTLRLSITLDLAGSRAQAGPDAIGVGTAIPHLGADTQIFGNTMQPRITTSSQAGAASLSLDRVAPGTVVTQAGFLCACYFVAGDVARYLLFETDAAWSNVAVHATAGGQDAPFTVLRGSGATAVVGGAPSSEGLAVSTPGGVAGASTLTAELPAGAAGAVSTHCFIGACDARWRTPDGIIGGIAMTGNVVYASGAGRPGFAGPRGTWKFAWSGVSNDPIVAAYAPIGGLWPAFR